MTSSHEQPTRRAGVWWKFVLFFVGLTVSFYAPIVAGWRTFPDGDFTHHFFPFQLFHLQELRAGHLPIWNPYTYAGHPFLADVQAAVFYPISNILLLLTWPYTELGARLYFLQVEAIVHVAMGGMFVALFVHGLTKHRWSALFGGVAFAFSGYLTGYPPLQLAVLRTAIWLPLALWALLHGFTQPGQWRWWIGAGLAYVAALLAGHSQTFLHASYVIAAWIVFLFLQTRARWGMREQMGLAGGVAMMGVVALGISAAQWLPSLEFVGLSVRAVTDYSFVSGGFPLQDTWQLLLPGVFTQYSPLYVGVVGLGMAFVAVYAAVVRGALAEDAPWRGPVLPGATVLFFVGVALVALFVSYGENGFLFRLFYCCAPGWKLFRGQERAAYLVVFGLSVLGGYGVALLPQMRQLHRRRIGVIFGAVTTAGVYGFGLLWQLLGKTTIDQWHYLIIAVITMILSLAVALLIWLPGWSRRRYLWLTLLLIGNLFWSNAGTNVAPFGPERKTILSPEMEAVQQAVYDASVGTGSVGRVYNEFRIYDDYGMRLEVEDVWGSSPLRLARYALLFKEFPLDRMWRLTGVEHILTWRRELFVPSDLLAEFPQMEDTTYLHRLQEENPRAWIVARIEVGDDVQAAQLLGDHSFELDTTAVVSPEEMSTPVAFPADENDVQLTRVASNQLQVVLESEQGGVLVIGENWMPGWTISGIECEGSACAGDDIEGEGIPRFTPFRVNLTLLGVVVPPGDSRFTLTYFPNSVGYGLWISGVSLLLVCVVALLRLWLWRRAEP